ncbi:MAG: hypothetical protein ACNI27_12885 [Desulfovibrio sp.]
MRNAFATFIGIIVTCYVLSFFIGPGEADEPLSTGDFILSLVIGLPVMLGVVSLFGEPTHSERSREEQEEDG